MPDVMDIEAVKDEIAKKIVDRAKEYADAHQQFKQRATEIYYAFIGKFLSNEGPSEGEGWKSKLYPKMMKPKILAAWSQYVQAATANKGMWEVEPRGINTDRSSKAAKMMKQTMQEQADAGLMHEKLKSGALDKFLYGTLFWQAPVVEAQVQREWAVDMSSMKNAFAYMGGKPVWKAKSVTQDMPSCLHRNYFEMYPWPYAGDPQRGEGVIHRPFLSSYELSSLRDEPGFDSAVIDELLSSGPESPPTTDRTDERMTTRGWMMSKNRKGFDLIFCSGRFGASDLKGVPGFEDEKGRYAEILIWVVNHGKLGPKIIKLVANPIVGKYRPFMMSHYEQMPHEALGVGIGENSIDIAKGIGGSIRLFLDGKKMSLPQIGVNTRYFGGGTIEFSPMKIWPFDGQKPSDVLFPMTLPDNTAGLIPLIEMLERFHDEITGIPKWTTGVDSKMLNKTATGISMIMNASSQLIRGAIENMDDYIIGPTGERFYDWNMENNPDPDIKGAFIISASGISSLMQKETLNQQLMGLVSLVGNPAARQDPYMMRLIRMIGDGMGIKDVDAIMPDPDKMHAFEQGSSVAAANTLTPSAPPGAPVAHGGPGNGGMNV
jgi:hypothetical protein